MTSRRSTLSVRGDQSLFAREDWVEAAWRVVGGVLDGMAPPHPYGPGTWGPPEAVNVLVHGDRWHEPAGTPTVAGASATGWPLADRYPARHYVIVDDKLRILTMVKRIWGHRVTTLFLRQGHYALDPRILAAHPVVDLTIERLGDLLAGDSLDPAEPAPHRPSDLGATMNTPRQLQDRSAT